MDNEYTRKEVPCPLLGEEYCDQLDKNCNRCIAQEEAWERIQCYIDCHGYDWTYERLRHDYQIYYMRGAYCSHTCMDVIKNNEADCRILFGKEVM